MILANIFKIHFSYKNPTLGDSSFIFLGTPFFTLRVMYVMTFTKNSKLLILQLWAIWFCF